jgi:hypothetical protein
MHLCRKCAEKYAISDKCINIENRTENCNEVEYVNKWSMSGTLLGIFIFVICLTAEFFGIYVLTVTIPTIETNITSIVILTFQVCVMMVLPVVIFGLYYFLDDDNFYNLWCVRITVAISWLLFLANILMFAVQPYYIYDIKMAASLILFTIIDFLAGVWSFIGWLDGDF